MMSMRKKTEEAKEKLVERLEESKTCFFCGSNTSLTGLEWVEIYEGNGEELGEIEVCEECYDNLSQE